MSIMKNNPKERPVLLRSGLQQLDERIHMKSKNLWQKWLPLTAVCFALAGQSVVAGTDFLIPPGAVEPGGGTNDDTPQWVVAFQSAGAGSASIAYSNGVSSEPNIAGSLYMTIDCVGGPAQGASPQSPNLALFLSMSDGYLSGWLGNPGYTFYNLANYSSISFDIKINTAVSSNTDIPLAFWAQYSNDRLEPNSNNGQNVDLNASTDGWGMGLTNASQWTHVVIPITPTLTQYGDVNGFGCYEWCETSATTPPAHLEFWIDNMRLTALTAPPPPPTMAVQNLGQTGLLLDSPYVDSGNRNEIWTANSYAWEGASTKASPMTYSLTISSVPNPGIFSNWEANIFLAPQNTFGNPENNGSDVGWLQILDNSDGTAIATMHWKTNSIFNYAMLYNTNFGGLDGTNNALAAGLLGTLNAPSIVGVWSISFTSDTNFTVNGPGGASASFSIPESWLQVWDADDTNSATPAVYAAFGDDSYSDSNKGLMWLSSVSVSGGTAGNGITNNFSAPLDTSTWAVSGKSTVVSDPTLLVSWTVPADLYTLEAAASLDSPINWTAATNSATEPITIYEAYTNYHALIPVVDLPSSNGTFFALNRSVATALQVLMPGETNAPGTSSGKSGTPLPQTVGVPFNVTINALTPSGIIQAGCSDTVTVASSDPGVGSLIVNLTAGTATQSVTFATVGSQTISATDSADATVSTTGNTTTVNP